MSLPYQNGLIRICAGCDCPEDLCVCSELKAALVTLHAANAKRHHGEAESVAWDVVKRFLGLTVYEVG